MRVLPVLSTGVLGWSQMWVFPLHFWSLILCVCVGGNWILLTLSSSTFSACQNTEAWNNLSTAYIRLQKKWVWFLHTHWCACVCGGGGRMCLFPTGKLRSDGSSWTFGVTSRQTNSGMRLGHSRTVQGLGWTGLSRTCWRQMKEFLTDCVKSVKLGHGWNRVFCPDVSRDGECVPPSELFRWDLKLNVVWRSSMNYSEVETSAKLHLWKVLLKGSTASLVRGRGNTSVLDGHFLLLMQEAASEASVIRIIRIFQPLCFGKSVPVLLERCVLLECFFALLWFLAENKPFIRSGKPSGVTLSTGRSGRTTSLCAPTLENLAKWSEHTTG